MTKLSGAAVRRGFEERGIDPRQLGHDSADASSGRLGEPGLDVEGRVGVQDVHRGLARPRNPSGNRRRRRACAQADRRGPRVSRAAWCRAGVRFRWRYALREAVIGDLWAGPVGTRTIHASFHGRRGGLRGACSAMLHRGQRCLCGACRCRGDYSAVACAAPDRVFRQPGPRATNKRRPEGRQASLQQGLVRFLFLRGGGTSVQVPWATSAAMPTVSPRVGCGWMVLPISTASQPISMARQTSPIMSPADGPTMAPPMTRCVSGVEDQLGEAVVGAVGDGAAGGGPRELGTSRPCGLPSWPGPRCSRPMPLPDGCRPRPGCTVRVEGSLVAGGHFGGDVRFMHRLVGQHRVGRRCRRWRRCAARWCASGYRPG